MALGGLLAGCESIVGRDETQFPAPPPTTGAPSDPRPVPTRTEWPRLRADPGNTGHRPGVTAVPDDPAEYWSFFVRATPPVVSDETLYTVEERLGWSLVARDAATGRVEWVRERDYGGGLGAPTVADGRLVVQSFGSLWTVDRETGEPTRERDLGRGPPGPPVVRDGVAFLASGSFSDYPAVVFAYDLAAGETRWERETSAGQLHLRGSVAVGDDCVFAGDGDLVAIEAADGTVRWRTGFDSPVETTPTVADGTVYVTDAGGTCHAVSTADGTERWTAAVGEPEAGTAPAVAGEEVYVPSATGLSALTTGGEARWTAELTRARTPSVDTECVYVGEAGFEDRAVVAVGRTDGGERWRRETDEQRVSDTIRAGVHGPPTLVDGGVYVPAADGIHALGRS